MGEPILLLRKLWFPHTHIPLLIILDFCHFGLPFIFLKMFLYFIHKCAHLRFGHIKFGITFWKAILKGQIAFEGHWRLQSWTLKRSKINTSKLSKVQTLNGSPTNLTERENEHTLLAELPPDGRLIPENRTYPFSLGTPHGPAGRYPGGPTQVGWSISGRMQFEVGYPLRPSLTPPGYLSNSTGSPILSCWFSLFIGSRFFPSLINRYLSPCLKHAWGPPSFQAALMLDPPPLNLIPQAMFLLYRVQLQRNKLFLHWLSQLVCVTQFGVT